MKKTEQHLFPWVISVKLTFEDKKHGRGTNVSCSFLTKSFLRLTQAIKQHSMHEAEEIWPWNMT